MPSLQQPIVRDQTSLPPRTEKVYPLTQFRPSADFDFDGRCYPTAFRATAAPVPSYLGAVEKRLKGMLKVAGDSRVALFKQYAQSSSRLGSMSSQVNKLLEAIGKASGNSAVPLIREVSQPKSFGVELSSLSLDDVQSTMNAEIARTTQLFVAEMLDAFDALVDAKKIGLIKWADPKSCRFVFYSYSQADRQTNARTYKSQSSERARGGRVHSSSTSTNRDFERVHRLGVHVHDLLGAERHRLPAEQIDPPRRVGNVIRAIPDWLREDVEIVTGHQIREVLAEMDVHTERWTETERSEEIRFEPIAEPRVTSMYQWDPAVVFGHYVFAGWTAEEGERAETARLQLDAKAAKERRIEIWKKEWEVAKEALRQAQNADYSSAAQMARGGGNCGCEACRNKVASVRSSTIAPFEERVQKLAAQGKSLGIQFDDGEYIPFICIAILLLAGLVICLVAR